MVMEDCPLKESFPFIICKCSVQTNAQVALYSLTFGLGEWRTNKTQVMEAAIVYDLSESFQLSGWAGTTSRRFNLTDDLIVISNTELRELVGLSK